MANPNFEHIRPELHQTIIFGETPIPDSEPIEAANGRLIPSYKFSDKEFRLLWNLAKEQSDGASLELFDLPSNRQLARIGINRAMGCWELPTYDDPKPRARYGSLSVGDIPGSLAHRTMYQVFYGVESLRPEQKLDHLCENKPCCYPRHLEPVSMGNNTIRAVTSRRHIPGQFGFDFED